MDKHSLEVLEYDKIKDLLRRYLTTSLGKRPVDLLQPQSDVASVREELHRTSQARRAIDQLLEAPLDPVHDLGPLLEQIRPEGSYLDCRQLLQVCETLQTVERLERFCHSLSSEFDRLKEWGERLDPLEEVVDAIRRTVDEEARVKDSASRQLKAIRGNIREAQDWIVRRLEKMIRRQAVRECLQEPYFTQREGRYVLPVETRFKGRIKGIVHDCSDTGITTFIEPSEIVGRGNRLRELQAEQDIEVRKILRQLSARIRKEEAAIRTNLETIALFDYTYAKGRLSAVFSMQEPEVADCGPLRIVQGRHPLLIEALKEAVVPLDIALGDPQQMIVLTGPNTGGKTVVLKTLGILCLMAASGLHLPALDGTRIVLKEQVFADIGDEQSIERNLSTFSSHMRQISRFVTECDSRSLVLLDELGTGTDPVEGGALAASVLEALRRRGAMVLVTTHLNELKVFAYRHEGVENAAMAFDLETLQPAYRLVTGIPGSSYALDIASRLGLPDDLITEARKRLEGRREDAEALLERLSTDARMAESARQTAEDEKQKAESLRLDLARRLDSVAREKGHMQQQARHEARGMLDDFQRRIRETERQLGDLLETAREAKTVEEIEEATRAVEKVRQKQMALRLEASQQFQPAEEPPQWEPVPPDQLQEGQMVQLQGFVRPGRLMTLDRKKKLAEVQVQQMHVQVPFRRIQGVVTETAAEQETAHRRSVTVDLQPTDEHPHSIDIHGLTQDEAYPLLERYIDRAVLAGWQHVYIIHGHGSGVLKEMTRRFLSKHPLVRSIRPGDYFEGGTGVTVAYFQEKG